MSKIIRAGALAREAVSQCAQNTPRSADLKDTTKTQKLDFLESCRKVCPGFMITEDMNPLLNDLLRWCLMLEGRYDPKKGLWLWGSVGTGKSTMLEIIRDYCRKVRPAEAYRDPLNPSSARKRFMPYGFRTTNASYVTGVFAKEGYEGIDEYITTCRQAFDEVGRESIPTVSFGNMENVFQYILQRRYDLRHGDFTHVTSNLSPEGISSVYGDHIRDRCREMFNFVKMSGMSWR